MRDRFLLQRSPAGARQTGQLQKEEARGRNLRLSQKLYQSVHPRQLRQYPIHPRARYHRQCRTPREMINKDHSDHLPNELTRGRCHGRQRTGRRADAMRRIHLRRELRHGHPPARRRTMPTGRSRKGLMRLPPQAMQPRLHHHIRDLFFQRLIPRLRRRTTRVVTRH